jgi:excisionase family DNA binding protein
MPLTTEQSAELLGVHHRSVSRACKLGLLRATKLAGHYLIDRKDLHEFSANHPTPWKIKFVPLNR